MGGSVLKTPFIIGISKCIGLGTDREEEEREAFRKYVDECAQSFEANVNALLGHMNKTVGN